MHSSEFVKILFTKQSVFPQGKPVVSAEDNNRALELTFAPQALNDPSNVMVETCDAGVIVGNLLFGVFDRTRPWRELFVANSHLAVVKGMHRHERFG